MASAVTKRVSADEFLLWSLDQEARYEFVDGIPIQMMTGASDVHDRIAVNVLLSLGNQLRGKRCRPTTADLLERIGCRLVLADLYEDTGLWEGERAAPEEAGAT